MNTPNSMNNSMVHVDARNTLASFSSRDLIAIGFRQKRTILITFCAIVLGAAVAALVTSPDYQASTKFLIERSRMDPVVSPGQDQAPPRSEVTEEELNSEVELLQSDDVLRQVVVATGLNQRKKLTDYILHWNQTPEQKLERTALRLQKELKIEAVKKSNLIDVSYSNSDPAMAQKVLAALDDAYLQKNLAVHHPKGEFEFFNQETQNYQKNLADAESQLKAFSQEDGGVSPQMARDITLQKLSDFNATLQQTYADIASTEQRIDALEKQAGTTPQRITTQSSASDDASVLQNLKSTLMTLELKRTELLTKYQPTYPLVEEVDKEIADTKTSIATEESKPLKAETTDRNTTYSWITEELAKAKADDSALKAKATSIQVIEARYSATAHELDQKGIQQQDLLRKVKTEEENYLLYQHKREEARMTDALDQTRILNVAIAEQPVTPALPSNNRLMVFGLGVLLAVGVSVVTAFTLEFTNPSFRTPSEVVTELNIPVLAAVPHYTHVFAGGGHGNGHANGNGNGNGNGRTNGKKDEEIHHPLFVGGDGAVD